MKIPLQSNSEKQILTQREIHCKVADLIGMEYIYL